MIKISIIIPVYNGLSNHIDKALESIYNQNLNNCIEIICVDDCSTDNSFEFLRSEQLNHGNLIVLKTNQNLRQGGARNLGIKSASGDYIMFLDQDDYYSKGALQIVIDHLSIRDLDVLVCDSAWQIRGKESFELQHNLKFHNVMKGDEFLLNNGIPYAPWKFVINSKMFSEYNIFFEPSVRIEDVDWSLKLTHYANRMQYQPILLIHYNRGEGSTSWDSYKSFETIEDTLKMAKRVLLLNNNVFNTIECKDVVERISLFYFAHSLKQFNYIPGLINEKISAIGCHIDVVNSISQRVPIIVRCAIKAPHIYSVVSHLVSPFCRCLCRIYRKIKYKI